MQDKLDEINNIFGSSLIFKGNILVSGKDCEDKELVEKIIELESVIKRKKSESPEKEETKSKKKKT